MITLLVPTLRSVVNQNHSAKGLVVNLSCRYLILIVFFVGATGFAVSAAESSNPNDDAEFKQSYDTLRQSLAEFPQKFNKTFEALKNNTDPDSVDNEMKEFRGLIATDLSLLADNGKLKELSDSVLNYDKQKLDETKRDSHYSVEQRQKLVDDWQSVVNSTSKRIDQLDLTRSQLTGMLQLLQTHEDFVRAQVELSRARDSSDLLGSLSEEVQKLSADVQKLLAQMNLPTG